MRFWRRYSFLVVLALFASCLGPDGNGPETSLSPYRLVTANYEQTVAETYAPYLRFDSKQGESNYCFPSDAAEYYDARMSGSDDQICNTDYSKIENGEVPIYYEYHKCQEDIVIISASADSIDGCVTLLAGQTLDVGTVCLENVGDGTEEQLRITYTTKDGWELVEAHLWVGGNLSEIPQTRKGNPKVGHFPYSSGDLTGLTSYSFYADPLLCNETLHAAAHAVVRKDIGNGKYRTESAWGSGPRIVEKGNWATYFTAQQTCTEYIMYWFFYGYQNACLLGGMIPVGSHDSDWERIAVKIVNGQLDRVMYYQHSGWYTKLAANIEIQTGAGGGLPGVHPVVYVGKKSHASFHEEGGGPEAQECCYFRDFHEPGGADKHMHTELNLVHLSLDESSPEWMKYDKSWDNWGASGEGPLGPLFQGPVDRCNVPGCYGSDELCDAYGDNQQGCLRSDIPENENF